MRILIIDDDHDDTEIFCEALHDVFPEAICTVKDSCAGINVVLQELPTQDVIFLDSHLTTSNGQDCLRKLHELLLGKKTKIVIHTGDLSPREVKEFRLIGVDHILFKASGYEAIKSNIQSLLTQSGAE